MQKNLSRHLTKYLFVSLLSKKNTQAQRAIYSLRQLHSHLHCHSSIHGRQANRQAGTLANCHKPEEHRSLVKRRRFVSLARKEKKNRTKPRLRYFHERRGGEAWYNVWVHLAPVPTYLRTTFTTCSLVMEPSRRERNALEGEAKGGE